MGLYFVQKTRRLKHLITTKRFFDKVFLILDAKTKFSGFFFQNIWFQVL